MSETSEALRELRARIEAVEESYEFFLAYAAQGVSGDGASKSGGQLRDFLARTSAALDGMAEVAERLVAGAGLEPEDAWRDTVAVLARDAAAARAAVRLVEGRSSISSQLVDNLNANIHLRSLLTDLFLLDEALPPAGG